MTALQRPGQARPEAGQARLPGSARQADDVSLLDNLSAQLDGRSGAASARGLVAPAQRPLRESCRSVEGLFLLMNMLRKRQQACYCNSGEKYALQ